MLKRPKPGIDEIASLTLLAAILFGAWFRIMPAWFAGFPVNDGGMFYAMILDLKESRYLPPLFTTYNNLDIPFVYPSLGFYLAAGLSDLLSIPPLEIIRWLPGILNALCIPAFYFLAREILGNKLTGALATLVYAMIPHLTTWPSMGGGLTRSLGTLFMLFTIAYAWRSLSPQNQNNGIRGAIIFGSLTTLSHTEAPIYTTAIALYIWLMKSRTVPGLRNYAWIAAGVLILAGPWYATGLRAHGLAPFISALGSGLHSGTAFLKLLNIAALTEEPYLTLLGSLCILAMAWLLARKEPFIPGMLLVIFIAQPRSAHTIGNIPLAMAAGLLLAELFVPRFVSLQEPEEGHEKKANAAIFISVLAIYLFANSAYHGLGLAAHHVSNGDRAAMEWIATNTPADARVLVVTGEQNPFCDATSEWFPALSQRKSPATVQGREWILGTEFVVFMNHSHRLQACIDQGLECLAREAEYFDESSHVYVSSAHPTRNCELAGARANFMPALVTALENSPDHSMIYHSQGVFIFQEGITDP